ncbi:MAG: glycosidase, partial [Myxococcota bacterium]
APPAEDLWEVSLRAISNPYPDLRLLVEAYAARGQSRGSDERLIDRYGLSWRATYDRWAFAGFLKIDDWGPYDFHKDFNLTFPLQTRLDLSYGAVAPDWFYRAYTQFGVRGQWRTLDEFSPRYDIERSSNGREVEILTYLNVNL